MQTLPHAWLPRIRLIIIAVPICATAWLFVRYFSFSGTYTVTTDFGSESAIVSALYPHGRAMDREKDLDTQATYQRVVGEPVYMDVDVPRSFDSVDVTAVYENPSQPLLKIGVVTIPEPQAVSLQPFENSVIDHALKTWSRIDGADGLTLLQRTKTVESVDAFIANPPADQVIGTYEYALKRDYTDPRYAPATEPLTINRLLRGSHTFLTYIKNETLHVDFTLRDINAESNPDSVAVNVYHNDAVVYSATVADDGITDASRVVTDPRTMTVDLSDLAEGVYTIDIKTTNDTIIQQIRTNQRYFVAQQHISLINTVAHTDQFDGSDTTSATLYFSGNQVIAHTDELAGIQQMTIDDDVVNIAAMRTPYPWLRTTTAVAPYRVITLPQSSVVLDGRGVYAFTQDSFFDPNGNIQPLDEASHLDEFSDILFRNYHAPEVDDRTKIKTQHTTISLNGVAGDRKHLTFVLSAPGITQYNAALVIHSMQYTFHRQPFLNRLWERFFH